MKCLVLLSARGVLAEGAKFFLISPDFDARQLAELSPSRQEKVEMFEDQLISRTSLQTESFSFYSLLDNRSKEYTALARRLRLCYFRDGAEVCSIPPHLVLLHDGLLVVSEAANLLRHQAVFRASDDVSCDEEQVGNILHLNSVFSPTVNCGHYN